MSHYDQIAELSVTIESVGRRRYVADTTSGFERTTTEFRLSGDGVVGRGEDVTYEAADHDALAETDPIDIEGEWTIDELSDRLAGTDLFRGTPPERSTSRNYRRWAVESAALDLALRQRDESLGECLGIEPGPVRFVVSTRLGDPPSTDRVAELLARDPDLEFKLDPTPDWPEAAFETLRETDAVRVLDLKGWYEGTAVDVEPDPELYRDVFAAFPAAVVEDPAFTPATTPLVEPQADRLAFDYPSTASRASGRSPWNRGGVTLNPPGSAPSSRCSRRSRTATARESSCTAAASSSSRAAARRYRRSPRCCIPTARTTSRPARSTTPQPSRRTRRVRSGRAATPSASSSDAPGPTRVPSTGSRASAVRPLRNGLRAGTSEPGASPV